MGWGVKSLTVRCEVFFAEWCHRIKTRSPYMGWGVKSLTVKLWFFSLQNGVTGSSPGAHTGVNVEHMMYF